MNLRTCQLVALLGFMTIWPCAGAENAGEVDAKFQEANRHYELRDYPAAINGYQQLLANDHGSAAVHFNLGNAWFMSGNIGRAIWHYRIARAMEPRDADVTANLQFARSQVGGSAPDARSQRWTGWLSLNEWAGVSAGLFWIWILGRVALQLNKRAQHSPKIWVRLAFFAWLISALALALAWHEGYKRQIAIVIADGEVRFGPFPESQLNYPVRDGTELALLDEREGWVQVEDLRRGVGWIQRKLVWLTGRRQAEQNHGSAADFQARSR